MIRRTPLRKVRPTPRKWKCVVCRDYVIGKVCPTCKSRKGTMRKALTRRADALWAKAVKSKGYCEARGFEIDCAGSFEAAHVVPRRHRSTRWLLGNGMSLCSGHHRFYTTRERMWRDFVGGENWDRLWDLAQTRWDGTYPIPELNAALATTKEAA